MIEFAWPYCFFALPLPVLAWLLLPRARGAAGAALRVPFFAELAALEDGGNRGRGRGRMMLAIVAWLLLVCAAARPQWIGAPVSLPVSGRDLLLAVDVSGSMKIKDMELEGRAANRLEVIKQVAGDFIQRRRGDRIGLILFGTRAYLQAPLSLDRQTVKQLLDEAMIGIAGKKTAIGDAIGLAVKRLRERPGQKKVLILLTDGANTAGTITPLKAAELAAKLDVVIYTIGIGAERMVVDTFFGRRLVNPSSDLDETTLKKIAELTHGHYFRAREREDLEKIYAIIDKYEPVVDRDQALRPIHDLFYWPLALALAAAFILLLSGKDEL